MSIAIAGSTAMNINFAKGKMQIDSPRHHNKKTLPVRGGLFLCNVENSESNNLNATVRWTVARPRLDGDDTIILSNTSISFVDEYLNWVKTT